MCPWERSQRPSAYLPECCQNTFVNLKCLSVFMSIGDSICKNKQLMDGWQIVPRQTPDGQNADGRTRAGDGNANCCHCRATPGLREACGRAGWLCIISVWLPQLQERRVVKQLQAVLPVQQLPHLRWENASRCEYICPLNESGALSMLGSSSSILMSPYGCNALRYDQKSHILIYSRSFHIQTAMRLTI